MKTEAVTRERIFAAAVQLFARRGFEVVGIRDIARDAGANIAGVNYHFGGKLGLLKAVVERYTTLYWEALGEAAEQGLSLPEHVRSLVRALIRFYRDNSELALAAENSGMTRLPEVNSLVARLRATYRERNNEYFAALGLNLQDPAAMTVMRGMLTIVISAHFHARFEQEVVAGAPRGLSRTEQAKLPELKVHYDGAFYERYADQLAAFYLSGVRALRARAVQRAGPKRKAVR